MATPRQMRWAARMSEFDFKIKYAPGKTNVVADGLSRAAAGGPEEEPYTEELLMSAIGDMSPIPVRVRRAALQDPEYAKLLALSDEELKLLELSKSTGLLYRAIAGEHDGVLVVPASDELRAWLLSWSHDAAESGHRGAARMAEWLKHRVWWKNMDSDAARYSRGCEDCQRNKPDLRGRQGLPQSIETPERIGQVLCMDFVGPFTQSVQGNNAGLVVVDKLSRWTFYIALKTTSTAQDVLALLETRVFTVIGRPEKIISDRDSKFTSSFWGTAMAGLRIQLARSTAFHPQTDGTSEKAVRTFVKSFRAYADEHQSNWETLLSSLQNSVNSSVCASTGQSPWKMVFGCEMPSQLDAKLAEAGVDQRGHPGARELQEAREAAIASAREKIATAQAKQQRDSAKGRREGEIQQGDKVWLSRKNLKFNELGLTKKLASLYYGPYLVLEMRNSNAARLEMPAGCRLHPVFNLDLLKKFIDGRAEFPDRPVRDERPGPEPEEDPAAGGPASVLPAYEVESILAARYSGAKRQFRVKWKGWPMEQATWEPRDHLENSSE